MPGQVTFTVDAQTAKAVDGVLKITGAQQKVNDGFARMKEGGKHAHGALEDISHAAKEAVAAFASWEGISSIVEKTVESIRAGTEAVKHFNATAIGAKSQPRYLEHGDDFDKRSTSLSSAFGMDVNQVVNPLRDKIATEVPFNTPDATVRQFEESSLKSAKFTGQSPQDVFSAEKKLREAYPKLSVAQSEDTVEFFRERGGMKADKLNEFQDTTQNAFSMMKTPLRDVQTLGSVTAHAPGDISGALKQLMIKIPELANPERKGGAVITHGDSIEGIIGDLTKLRNEKPAEFMHDVGRRAAVGAAYLTDHPEAIAAARRDVDTFKPGSIDRIEESMDKSGKVRAGHLNEAIEQTTKNLPIEMTTAGEMGFANKQDLKTLGGTLQLPQAGAWGGYVVGRIPQIGTHASEMSSEEIGREYVLKKQAQGRAGGPEDQYLKYRDAVQKDITNLTHTDFPYGSEIRTEATHASNIGSKALFESNRNLESGNVGAGLEQLKEAHAKMLEAAKALNEAATMSKEAAHAHIEAAKDHKDAATAQKQTAEKQQQGQRRVNYH